MYETVKAELLTHFTPGFFGDPQATTAAVLKLVDSENPPLRLLLGKVAYPFVQQTYEARWAEWNAWKPVSDDAHGL
ncbi:hypothetical protein [Spirosoma telluris]|uniref:hypothetical protein n=1 Tax=Spirosoma telluris TaxID=2183553 RepID=UPI002FC2ECA5